MSKEEKDFYNYVVVQYSGRFNMIVEANEVADYIGVSMYEYWEIINNYGELKEKYPEIYEKAKKEGDGKIC